MKVHVYRNRQPWYFKILKYISFGLISLRKHECMVMEKTEALDQADYDLFDKIKDGGWEIELYYGD